MKTVLFAVRDSKRRFITEGALGLGFRGHTVASHKATSIYGEINNLVRDVSFSLIAYE